MRDRQRVILNAGAERPRFFNIQMWMEKYYGEEILMKRTMKDEGYTHLVTTHPEDNERYFFMKTGRAKPKITVTFPDISVPFHKKNRYSVRDGIRFGLSIEPSFFGFGTSVKYTEGVERKGRQTYLTFTDITATGTKASLKILKEALTDAAHRGGMLNYGKTFVQ